MENSISAKANPDTSANPDTAYQTDALLTVPREDLDCFNAPKTVKTS